MCTLYNNSIKQGKVLKIWKSAHITPLPKVKGANQPKDFRPIALTPILAKCFERLVSPYIKDKIDDTNQYAYRRNRSTDDALLILLDRITYHLDKSAKNYVRAVFIDFSSAFNTINSSILIQRLTDKQINSNIIAWVYDFLTDRSQRVKTCNEISEALTVSTGCPQGCVLSPILFSLYVECMTVSGSNMHMVKYADDTVIIELCSPDQATNLQAEMSHIAAWCEDNSLLINSTKTKEIVFCNKRDEPNPATLDINGSEIQRVDEYKYLGTIVEKKLSFKSNTDNIIKKANKRLYIMKQLAFLKVQPSTIRLAYTTFIESVLSYHLSIIFGHLIQDDTKLYNHTIKTARLLSNDQIERQTINEVYDKQFKTKCLRLTCCGRDNIIALDKLPSGRYLIPKHRVNARKFCFRSNCVRLLNRIFS